MFRFLIVGLFGLLLPLPALAVAYDCETTSFGRGGWVPPRIILGIDSKTNAGSVYDGFIHEIHQAPIPVDLTKRSDTSYRFKWRLKGLKARNGGRGINSYSLILNTKRGRFTLSGQRHGYDNVISASGKCSLIK